MCKHKLLWLTIRHDWPAMVREEGIWEKRAGRKNSSKVDWCAGLQQPGHRILLQSGVRFTLFYHAWYEAEATIVL